MKTWKMQKLDSKPRSINSSKISTTIMKRIGKMRPIWLSKKKGIKNSRNISKNRIQGSFNFPLKKRPIEINWNKALSNSNRSFINKRNINSILSMRWRLSRKSCLLSLRRQLNGKTRWNSLRKMSKWQTKEAKNIGKSFTRKETRIENSNSYWTMLTVK